MVKSLIRGKYTSQSLAYVHLWLIAALSSNALAGIGLVV